MSTTMLPVSLLQTPSPCVGVQRRPQATTYLQLRPCPHGPTALVAASAVARMEGAGLGAPTAATLQPSPPPWVAGGPRWARRQTPASLLQRLQGAAGVVVGGGLWLMGTQTRCLAHRRTPRTARLLSPVTVVPRHCCRGLLQAQPSRPCERCVAATLPLLRHLRFPLASLPSCSAALGRPRLLVAPDLMATTAELLLLCLHPNQQVPLALEGRFHTPSVYHSRRSHLLPPLLHLLLRVQHRRCHHYAPEPAQRLAVACSHPSSSPLARQRALLQLSHPFRACRLYT
jgi:hypothetical protein